MEGHYRKDGTYVRPHTRYLPYTASDHEDEKPDLDMSKPVAVQGYYRKDGTYVRPHTRQH